MLKKVVNSAKRSVATLKSLRRDDSAVAMVEFAFAAPIVLSLGCLGTETAYFTVTHMQISQVAMQVADNASRVGEADVLVAKKVYERDINGTFIGAEKLGDGFGIYDQGRIIISSLQRNEDGGQWIAWQRCRGAKNHVSSYGVEGDGSSGTSFPGMGEADNRIEAPPDSAVIFVEVSYTYDQITPFDLFGDDELQYTAAFIVRDQRDLTQLYQTDPPSAVADCATFSADRPT